MPAFLSLVPFPQQDDICALCSAILILHHSQLSPLVLVLNPPSTDTVCQRAAHDVLNKYYQHKILFNNHSFYKIITYFPSRVFILSQNI